MCAVKMAECDYDQKMGKKTKVAAAVPEMSSFLSWLSVELGLLNLNENN